MATEPRSTTAPCVDGELMPQRQVLEDEISAGADRCEECYDKQTEVEHRRASRGSPILCYLSIEPHGSSFAVPRPRALSTCPEQTAPTRTPAARRAGPSAIAAASRAKATARDVRRLFLVGQSCLALTIHLSGFGGHQQQQGRQDQQGCCGRHEDHDGGENAVGGEHGHGSKGHDRESADA